MSILERTNSTKLLLNKGTRLADRYLIQEGISHTATSAVYRARDLHFPNVTKQVAVKEFYNPAPDDTSRQANFEKFERQVNLLATLSHRTLPGILDYFIRDKQAYLVLDFINGQTLADVLEASAAGLPPGQVVPWAIGLCELLQYLHNHEPAQSAASGWFRVGGLLPGRLQKCLLTLGWLYCSRSLQRPG
jgi:serine/threonine protein kinase